jgi:hypothetical protein
MSDGINPISAKSTQRLNQTPQVAPQRAVQAPQQGETGNQTSKVEGFQPTNEAKETLSDQKAGEAKASEILGAWSPQQTSGTAVAGQLHIEGASNTSVNQVHGANNESNATKPGFTAGTVYSSRPPGQ